MAEVPQESPVPSIGRPGNLEKWLARFKGLKINITANSMLYVFEKVR
jgi:hypothetical protein